MGWCQQGDHLKFSDRFNRLWNQRKKALAAYADVFVVVIRAIHREIVRARAQAVNSELASRTDAGAHAWSSHAAQCLRRRCNSRKQEAQFVKRARQSSTAKWQCRDFFLSEGTTTLCISGVDLGKNT